MLIKNIDEVIRRGKYDIRKNENVTVATICPAKIEEKLVVWEKLATAKVPRSQLHYNDASDASLVFFTSWQKFYAAGCEFGKIPLYSGSSNIFKDGKSTFGGAAKAAIYLRFSFVYQSHHTGLETRRNEADKERRRTYQSHHTGLETDLGITAILCHMEYQSHHTGLETC